jgi:hypothetical protein
LQSYTLDAESYQGLVDSVHHIWNEELNVCLTARDKVR